jgi:hypothetical protein
MRGRDPDPIIAAPLPIPSQRRRYFRTHGRLIRAGTVEPPGGRLAPEAGLRFVRRLLPAALLAGAGPMGAQEHAHHASSAERWWHAGLHGVVMGTHVRNGVGGEPVTEGYLTQPTLMAGASMWGGRLTGQATISLEGLTLQRGELAPGSYGEGYVDRRHPHTYLHEALLTLRTPGDDGVSLTAGRGFAAFGTDDPMARPFVRFPVNHHLGQVLERLVLIAAARRGPLVLEASLFSGDEPSDPNDLGTPGRFGDSWALRLTALPVPGMELQASRAEVESPELPLGGGWDQRKCSASARLRRAVGGGSAYALLEWKRTTELNQGEEVFSFGSVLGEASLTRARWTVAARAERTERPEEDRLSAYRTPWPHAELHVLGITSWTIGSATVQRELSWREVRVSPFVELSLAHVGERERGLFERERMYGGSTIGSVSMGARLGLGAAHPRMGRYGVAVR